MINILIFMILKIINYKVDIKCQNYKVIYNIVQKIKYYQLNIIKVLYTATDNGTIYSWDVEKIFSKEFLEYLKSGPKLADCFKLVIVD